MKAMAFYKDVSRLDLGSKLYSYWGGPQIHAFAPFLLQLFKISYFQEVTLFPGSPGPYPWSRRWTFRPCLNCGSFWFGLVQFGLIWKVSLRLPFLLFDSVCAAMTGLRNVLEAAV